VLVELLVLTGLLVLLVPKAHKVLLDPEVKKVIQALQVYPVF
jgi:hypothetical protein